MSEQKKESTVHIDWKARFRNRVWLAAFAAALTGFVYRVLSLLEIAPAVSEDTLTRAVEAGLYVLTVLGVVIDPTTEGISDGKEDSASEDAGQGLSDRP